MKKIITGIKATGDGMHIGNYLWAFKPFLQQAKNKEAYIFIADYHSLTSVHNGETMRKNKNRLLREYFALLPEDTNIVVFDQSQIKRINDITWILSSVTPYSLMLRAHSFKDSQNKKTEINMATFNYPVLMASDIISYDIDIVPVGKDQIQHIEFARDIAGYFNKKYGEVVFKLPEAHIDARVMTIPGIDGRKMSKSYDNFIGIFDSPKLMKRKIMSIVSGSETLDQPKDPDNCKIFALIKLFASANKQDEIAAKYRAGWYGYGHAKLELLDIILEYFAPARERFDSFENDMSFIHEKLNTWNEIANKLVDAKYEKLMKIVGLEKIS